MNTRRYKMNILWKAAVSPTIEETARELLVKKSLTTELGRVVRELQQENVGKDCPVSCGENVNQVCNCLEAIFIHGLKNRLVTKVSAVFSSNNDKMPEPDFWPLVMVYSHADVLSRITHLSQITTDIGRCRAWLRLALNDGLITSYIEAMVQDRSTLQCYYRSTAYLQDQEQPDIMKTYLSGLEVFTFQLTYNCMMLNTWSTIPLIMSGIWTPPTAPEPVMPAMDVVQFFSEEERKAKNKIRPAEVVEKKRNKKQSTHEVCSNKMINADSQTENPIKETVASISEKKDTCDDKTSLYSSDAEQASNYDPLASPTSIPDVDLGFGETTPDSLSFEDPHGNRLSQQQGWSSSFDHDETVEQDGDAQSYDSLLHSYNRNCSSMLVGTPDIADFMTSVVKINKDETSRTEQDTEPVTPSSEPPLESLQYEVVPTTYVYTSENTDDFTRNFLSIIGKICPEQGLDTQNYQCHNCGCPIGMIYGKSRVCVYDGHNYCSECHDNEEYYIPAKIIHNWDFQKYPMSKQARHFLTKIEAEPLLDMKLLNPLIYSAVEEMAQLQVLRTQLGFLKSYLFTCRESVVEELRKKVWPREHLYEHIHLYSLDDLIQAHSGALATSMQKVISFAKKHVMSCQLCSLKGFICEICNNPRVIYPFEIEMTYQCEKCLAVYHSDCMNTTMPCPKCERKQKRSSSKDFTWLVEDSE